VPGKSEERFFDFASPPEIEKRTISGQISAGDASTQNDNARVRIDPGVRYTRPAIEIINNCSEVER
jgi:hypothetical protein